MTPGISDVSCETVSTRPHRNVNTGQLSPLKCKSKEDSVWGVFRGVSGRLLTLKVGVSELQLGSGPETRARLVEAWRKGEASVPHTVQG